MQYQIAKLCNGAERLLFFDTQGIGEKAGLASDLRVRGFEIFEYDHVEKFRITYEERIKENEGKIAVFVGKEMYVPYDIRHTFHEIQLTLGALFPNLHPDTLAKYRAILPLISFADEHLYKDMTQPRQTEKFIFETAYSPAMLEKYCAKLTEKLRTDCSAAKGYMDWFHIAKTKGELEYYSARLGVQPKLPFLEAGFERFLAKGYGGLSQEISQASHYPPIVTKVLSRIVADKNEKSALIVMDGMSVFDFFAISQHMSEFEYDEGATFAIIPTTTALSRKSLLTGKFPREQEKPFTLADESKGFLRQAAELGIDRAEYLRGYDANISPLTKLAAIIINDIDDILHGQRQGRAGMYSDIDWLGKLGKLQKLIVGLTEQGFAVYITSDHGNTPCEGVGNFRSGVEIESRSKRMAVLKDIAASDDMAQLSEHTTEYAGYFLPKEYRYFVCKQGVSFDNKGEQVITHGSMSIDEVIVPFIKIKERK